MQVRTTATILYKKGYVCFTPPPPFGPLREGVFSSSQLVTIQNFDHPAVHVFWLGNHWKTLLEHLVAALEPKTIDI